MIDEYVVFLVAVLSAAIRLGTSIGLAAIGEVVSERAGVINVGVEGMMLVGAFASAFGAVATGSPWGGVTFGVCAGMLLAALHAWLVVIMRVDQIVSGIGIVIFGMGLSSFLFRLTLGASPAVIPGFQPVAIPGLSALPIVGSMLFAQSPLVYVCVVSAVVAGWVLNRTGAGLRIRSCGENPEAALAMGVQVAAYRSGAIIFGGAFAGLGGAFLVVSQINAFVEGMVAGRGFLAIACVVFARWRPTVAVLIAMAFGLIEAAQIRLQLRFPELPYQFLVMLPYIIATIGVVMSSRSHVFPRALGK